jgi:hypothetical protein
MGPTNLLFRGILAKIKWMVVPPPLFLGWEKLEISFFYYDLIQKCNFSVLICNENF